MSPLLASTALGLVAAWPVGALAWGLGRTVDRLTADPRPRAAAWSLAYALPAGALAATVALTFAPPPPAPSAAIVPGPARMAVAQMVDAPAAAPAWTPSPAMVASLAWSVLGLSAAGLLTRGARWNLGRRRLTAIRAAAEPCQDTALNEAVRLGARRLGVRAPQVRISTAITEPLLAGARHPVILLPQALVDSADARKLALVCGHELAHLKRGDNWRIPAEEALAGLFWLVPPVGALRARMLAAREAVCDRSALAGAAPEVRRDYARVLVEALRLNSAPSAQSAFTGRDRSLTSMRLSAILEPRDGASIGRLGLATVLGGALVVVTGAGSLALADQARRLTPPEIARVRAQAAQDAAPDDSIQPVAEVAQAPDAAPAKAMAADAKAIDAEPPADALAMTAEAAPVTTPVEAAPATPASPARAAAPARPARAALAALPALSPALPAPMAGLAQTSPLPPAPMGRGPAPRPNPRPDPHPDPRPNPQPDPQPNVAALDTVRTVARTQTETAAENRERVMAAARARVTTRIITTTRDTTTGDTTTAVAVKVDGRPTVRVLVPRDLAGDAIRQLKVVDTRPEPKVSVAVTVRSDTNPWGH